MGLMLIDVSLTEGRAWHEASDEAWAGYAAAVYAAAVERREHDAATVAAPA